ncbi:MULTISPECIES: MFS transporter [unclassified Pseudomonas]|uniref:MFS transporter n=1 Tax=unclassified Pseudomonas TaxID=196821 RepID=UPI000BDCC113|nr:MULTISPECIES: MFS transporter [unclassified Pseudomonas]PVZ10550.1 sugar phosphate permease [Pseudomonas sp. URIL14HWK12:I12]PVZ21976.1 sugar phosphate permease [Pseudomonas sp. URIL14HWK12:I10]PVZ30941.1 sugar phosphate permease [Pseudomonas sp. URIL14HWK12:I11]SNZ17356.1 Sugar phosphate permease [Pseudomonas sp. URIL14HWK12:I9]
MTVVALSDTIAKVVRSRYRWVVLTVIVIVYMLAAADRANIGIALPYIQKEFGASNAQAGLIVSAFFLFYSLGQIPAGFLLSKISVRVVAPVSIGLTSAVTLLIGTAHNFGMLKLYRSALGIAEAALPLAMLSTINRWFPPSEKGLATGAFLSAAKMGAVIAPPIGAALILLDGWRTMFIAFAIPGVLLALLWWWLVPNDPRASTRVNEAEATYIEHASEAQQTSGIPQKSFGVLDKALRYRHIQPLSTSRAVFGSWNVWGCGLGYLLMTGVVNVLLAWLPKYLGEVKHFELMQIGFVAALPFAGGVLGNIVGGWLSDKVLARRRKPTMVISAVATCLMMVALVYAPNDLLWVSLLLFGTGFLLNIGYSSFSVYSMGLTNRTTYPVAASLVNSAGQAGGAMAPLITGLLLDAYSWTMVFLFLGACSLGALLFVLTIAEPADAVETGA